MSGGVSQRDGRQAIANLGINGAGSVWILLAPHFSEVTASAAMTTSRFNGFHKTVETVGKRNDARNRLTEVRC
jgi:hypothetical protein